jgi:hypothetical protein
MTQVSYSSRRLWGTQYSFNPTSFPLTGGWERPIISNDSSNLNGLV